MTPDVPSRLVAAAAAGLLLMSLASCTQQAAPESSAAPSSSTSAATTPSNAVTLDITISKGQVQPNGRKIDLQRGQTVILNITSDQDDEIHAHTGGDGYEVQVKAGTPAHGQFTLTDPGSFEIESHHLEKIIAILNVR
jgi:hypothetical protein